MRITDQILGVKCVSLSLVLVTNVKNSQKFDRTDFFFYNAIEIHSATKTFCQIDFIQKW